MLPLSLDLKNLETVEKVSELWMKYQFSSKENCCFLLPVKTESCFRVFQKLQTNVLQFPKKFFFTQVLNGYQNRQLSYRTKTESKALSITRHCLGCCEEH